MFELLELVEIFHQFWFFEFRKRYYVPGREFIRVISDSFVDVLCFNSIDMRNIAVDQNAKASNLNDYLFQIFDFYNVAHFKIPHSPTKQGAASPPW